MFLRDRERVHWEQMGGTTILDKIWEKSKEIKQNWLAPED